MHLLRSLLLVLAFSTMPYVAAAQATTCGNRLQDRGETCDDGNTLRGDGCSSTCRRETGWTCAGWPSVCTHPCGNGRQDRGETCDDGNRQAGDGCSASCKIERGWTCSDWPIACTRPCGNGQMDAGETCDDSNALSGDGCSASCKIERGWVCGPTQWYATTCHRRQCGDGIVDDNESCEDGNTTAGDGCDATCQIEPYFACRLPEDIPPGGSACAPATFYYGLFQPGETPFNSTDGFWVSEFCGNHEVDRRLYYWDWNLPYLKASNSPLLSPSAGDYWRTHRGEQCDERPSGSIYYTSGCTTTCRTSGR